jgi:hypothetical protein
VPRGYVCPNDLAVDQFRLVSLRAPLVTEVTFRPDLLRVTLR